MKKYNIKPTQPTNDVEILLKSAVFVKPIFDKNMQYITNSFAKQNNTNKPYFIAAPNKNRERIEEKIKENDIGGYNEILDYVRGAIVFTNLDDLFNFVNFAKKFKFSELNLEGIKNNKLKIMQYSTDNFSLNKKFLTNEDRKKYTFLEKNSKLKTSEYMDLKLYIKIPTKSSEFIKEPYIIAEIVCMLEGFWKYYDLTHYLYEDNRSAIDMEEISNDEKNKQKAKKYLTYHIHRHNIIEEYNKDPNHRIKLVEINQMKEQEKNNFLASLPYSLLNKIKNEMMYKAANNTNVILQIKELFNSLPDYLKQNKNNSKIQEILKDPYRR